MEALALLAADRINGVFVDVSNSIQAVGKEYQLLAESTQPSLTKSEKEAWVARGMTKGPVTVFRTWAADASTPKFEADFAGLYNLSEQSLSDKRISQLQRFEQLIPVFRTAYESFDFSWVYLTTTDNMLLIYPFMTPKDAANTVPPTEKVFYKCADFKGRKVGWSQPYLDLAGAGMMVTASYPIYSQDKLLGVASRDITLQQLANSVLDHLVRGGVQSAFIISKQGRVIDASDAKLKNEIANVSSGAKNAHLYYRSKKKLPENGINSQYDWVNQLTDEVISRTKLRSASGFDTFKMDERQVLTAEIESTGWFVVLVLPHSR
ncbi:hypothetical protein [Rubellicoccus peritrichatus]|uniref:Cache domain-containing protein n=1 Tax=Rubellicoccus peritrichatus TaxID=3080537 RepID=A0AAQ3L5N5_9BACT|nr:hypothetical protein [Puniceicoccus sp. CR14]WOO39899.1 hypothetical protein RZN69_14835 [Puniceicoccus sp. CR14]